jgi:predicted ATPase
MSTSHKLNRIQMEGFRSIKKMELEIRDLNILIGQNGAGKSNLIGAFKFLREVIAQRLQVYVGTNGGANRILHYGSKETGVLSIELDFKPNHYSFKLIPTNNDSFIFNEEKCEFDSYYRYSENINSGGVESKLSSTKTAVSQYVIETLQSFRVYHFHDTSKDAKIKKFASVLDMYLLAEDAGNLAPFLNCLYEYHRENYLRIVKTIQLVIPFFKDFVFRQNPFNSDQMMLEWQDIYSDQIFNASDLSDGSIRFMCLATLLLQPNLPKVILLDEPELGLHPSAIIVLASLFRKASKRSQLIVSTQSVGLVNEFEPEDVIVVDRVGGESVFRRLESDSLASWLDSYSLGELWDKNILGGKP